jgi:DNA polymerase I
MKPLSGYIVTDIETTITTYMKRKASPFTPENWVVAAAHKSHGTQVDGRYYGRDRAGVQGYLAELLSKRPRFLVGFNIKFDIQHLIGASNADYEAWQAWVAEGGELWDTQLAEYLLEGMVPSSHMLSLDEVAPRYGGELKIDEVKAMWAQGINTPDIPQQLLMDYLVGRVEDGTPVGGDIVNTELVFLGQLKAAKASGQVNSIRLNNGALIATIEMERNGLWVDVELGRAQAKELSEKQAQMTGDLQKYLPTDMPFEFGWHKRRHLSALIFGGDVPYEQRVHQVNDAGNPAYAQMKVEGAFDHVSGGYIFSPDGDIQIAANEMEAAGTARFDRYGAGKKAGLVKTKQVDTDDYTRPKLKWETFYYRFKGFTKPRPEWKTADPGVYTTKAEVIEDLAGLGIPFLDAFADLADVIKDLGTYYIREELDEEGQVVKAKGMLTLVQPDGIVHHNINATGTVTARYSSNNPNLQNLPKESTSKVKQMFRSRWGLEGTMMSSDFTSLEVYGMAQLSHDAQLIADLKAGLDMHIARLSTVEDKTYEEVFRLVKIEKIHEWINKRSDIKVFSFQRAYGAGAAKIARGLKKAVELVQTWIDADEKRYPGVVTFQEAMAQEVKNSRKPTNKYVQHPTAKINLQLGIGQYTTFDGKVYKFQEHPAPDFMVKRGVLQSFSPTEMKNYPVQGLGGEWMKAALWLAVRLFYHYKNLGGLALLVNTVHDAAYVDAHDSVRRKAAVLLHAAMLGANDLIEYLFHTDVVVPVPAVTSWGKSLYEEEEQKDDDFLAAANRVRLWMRTQYMEGLTPSFEVTGD